MNYFYARTISYIKAPLIVIVLLLGWSSQLVGQVIPAPEVQCAKTDSTSIQFIWSRVPGHSEYEVRIGENAWADVGTNISIIIAGIELDSSVGIWVRVAGPEPRDSSFTNCFTSTCRGLPVSIQSASDISCVGFVDGSVQVSSSVSGATFWVNGISNSSGFFDGLEAGLYGVVVSDGTCIDIEPFLIGGPDTVLFETIIEDTIVCAGDFAAVSISTPIPENLTVTWDDGFVGLSRQDISGGMISFTAVDFKGCMYADSLIFPDPEILDVQPIASPLLCGEENTGTASVGIAGGIIPYQITWNDGTVGDSRTDLASGLYSIEVKDALGCRDTVEVNVIKTEPIRIIPELSDPSCRSNDDGTIFINLTGATEPLTFSWNSGHDSDLLENLDSGQYCVTVTDFIGCTIDTCLILNPGSDAHLQVETSNITCFGDDNGSIDLDIMDYRAPLSISWTGEVNYRDSVSLSNLRPGEYHYSIVDGGGCTFVDSILISEPDMLVINPEIMDVSCFGVQDGSIVINAEGGNGDYRYSFNKSEYTAQAIYELLRGGMYDISVIDGAGCSTSDEFILIEPDSFSFDLGMDTSVRKGTLIPLFPNIYGGTFPLTVEWVTNNNDFLSCQDCLNPIIRPDETIIMEARVMDANGCFYSDRITIYVSVGQKILVPTAFSPNLDSRNDVLLIHGESGIWIDDFSIYDRWGNIMFTHQNFGVNDFSVGWDGRDSGIDAQQGVYTWVASAIYEDGTTGIVTGTTTLLR